MLINTYAHNSQVPASVPNTDVDMYAVEVVPASEVRAFLDAIPEPVHVIEARWRYIDAWKSGAIGAVEALNALEAHGCLADAEEFMAAWVAGTEARLQLGTTPESPTAPPTAPEAIRPASPAQELLDAVAGARMSRRVA
jgi:hypothetical protein